MTQVENRLALNMGENIIELHKQIALLQVQLESAHVLLAEKQALIDELKTKECRCNGKSHRKAHS